MKFIEKYFLSKFNSKLNKDIVKLPNYMVSQPKYKIGIESAEEFNEMCEDYLKGYNNFELITDDLNVQSEAKATNKENGSKSKMHKVTTFVANVLG